MTNPRIRVEKIVGIDINPTRLGNAKLAFNKDFDNKFNTKMRRKTDLEVEVKFARHAFTSKVGCVFQMFIQMDVVSILPREIGANDHREKHPSL